MEEEKDIDQLIGAYIEGMLNEEDTARLEQKMSTDPELADLVNGFKLEQRVVTYLEGKPSATEKAAFEAELERNEELRKAWEDYHLTQGVVNLKKREQHIEWFEQMGKQGPGNNPSGKGPNRWPFLGGLLMVLLLIAGWWYLAPPNPAGQSSSPIEENTSGAGNTDEVDPVTPPSEPLEEEAPATLPGVPDPGDTAPIEQLQEEPDSLKIYASTFLKALPENIAGNNTLGAAGESDWERAFRRSAYSDLIPLLDPVKDSLFAAKATKPLFFLAAGYLLSEREDRYQEANAIFARLEAERAGHRRSLMQEVEWYHALALISEGRTAAARPLLQKIVDSTSHSHWNEARELVRLQKDSD